MDFILLLFIVIFAVWTFLHDRKEESDSSGKDITINVYIDGINVPGTRKDDVMDNNYPTQKPRREIPIEQPTSGNDWLKIKPTDTNLK